jgi:hypothetical protein
MIDTPKTDSSLPPLTDDLRKALSNATQVAEDEVRAFWLCPGTLIVSHYEKISDEIKARDLRIKPLVDRLR